jgi:hypothetical protein
LQQLIERTPRFRVALKLREHFVGVQQAEHVTATDRRPRLGNERELKRQKNCKPTHHQALPAVDLGRSIRGNAAVRPGKQECGGTTPAW